MKEQLKIQDKPSQKSMAFIQDLLGDYHPRNFSVRMWDGAEWPPESGEPSFTLVLKHPGALRQMLRDPSSDLSIGEAYIYNDFDIEGDIEAVYPVAEHLAGNKRNWKDNLQLGLELLQLPKAEQGGRTGRQAASISGQPHSVERDKQAVTYHYDVSSDFYALWLDRNMVYSCGYFSDPDQDIDSAQEDKLDYLCRKLRLEPGERVLDIGCGWGGLVIFAAQHYGVDALGITLSEPQAEVADERIKQAGLGDRCRVEVRDYREMDKDQPFDKLVSVGMFEHVGEALLPTYFKLAWRLLRSGGVFLNHGIASMVSTPRQKGPTFSNHYVFPDGELVPIHVTLQHAEEAGFEVRDVESLREHYAMTLRHWVRHLEAHHEDALRVVDEPTYRVWRLFMSGSAYGFGVGHLNVYQSLLAKPEQGNSGLPLTRADWYVT